MSATATDLKAAACRAVDELKDKLSKLSLDLWNHPELAYEEHYGHNALTDFLEKDASFPKVERSYVLKTGFRAEYGEGDSPNVCVICEYDALPDIGHACGHNLIAEVGIAAAVGIKAAIDAAKDKDISLGKVTVLGTPAEEGGGGKMHFIDHGTFKEIDAAMMCHPYSGVPSAIVYGTLCRQRFWVRFHGKASHAASHPWEGVNALDAVVMAYSNVAAMRQQMKPEWRVHGVITKGGTRPNIIPELTEMEYYIRAPNLMELQQLRSKVTGCFEGAGKATGCEVEFDWNLAPYYNVLSNSTLAELFEKNGSQIGIEFCGEEIARSTKLGSTDMGNVSHVVPSIHPLFNIGTSAANHTREFTAAAGDPIAQPYTLDQGKALAMTAIDIFLNPDLVKTMKDELELRMKSK